MKSFFLEFWVGFEKKNSACLFSLTADQMSGRNQSQCYVCHHKSHVGRVGGEEVVYEHCQTN